MSWFKKSPGSTKAAVAPVPAFWSWWTHSAKDRFAAAVDSGSWGELPTEMSEHVHAIDPGLQWELSAGTRARHTLCVTSAGAAELRPLAQRWRRAAPAEDAVWQYEPARCRDATLAHARLELDGHTLDLPETMVGVVFDEQRLSYDVVVHHPKFSQMQESQRQQFAFLVLDWALGEDDVERWVGGVEAAVDALAPALSIAGFVADVDAVADKTLEETWVLLQGQHPDGFPVVALARRPLRWIDSPLLDQHNEILLPYEEESNGLPTGASLEQLRQLEDALTKGAGPGAQLLAHETHHGRRRLHLYSDSEDQNVTESIDRWVRSTPGAAAFVNPDPAWRALRHLV